MTTATFGARRRNFRQAFIDGQTSGDLTEVKQDLVAKLPSDPENIMGNHW